MHLFKAHVASSLNFQICITIVLFHFFSKVAAFLRVTKEKQVSFGGGSWETRIDSSVVRKRISGA